MKKDGAEPDGLTILMMFHYLGQNIMLISGKAEEWKAKDIADDIIVIYHGDNQFTPIDVGIYLYFFVIL